MKEYKFEIYYKYEVNKPADFFEGEKNPVQIQDALADFENGISHYITSTIIISSSMPKNGDRERRIVSIKTDANKNVVIEAVKEFLECLDLKGKIL